MIKYKDNILGLLKANGYSTYRLRQNKIMGESKIQNIRNNAVSIETLNQLCELLHCHPGDILEYIPDDEETNEWFIATLIFFFNYIITLN